MRPCIYVSYYNEWLKCWLICYGIRATVLNSGNSTRNSSRIPFAFLPLQRAKAIQCRTDLSRVRERTQCSTTLLWYAYVSKRLYSTNHILNIKLSLQFGLLHARYSQNLLINSYALHTQCLKNVLSKVTNYVIRLFGSYIMKCLWQRL